jgi:hypothetical protein
LQLAGKLRTFPYHSIKLNELLDKCSEWSKKSGEEIFKEFEADKNSEKSTDSNSKETKQSKESKESTDSNSKETKQSKESEKSEKSKEPTDSNSNESNSGNISKDEFYALYRIFGRDVLIEWGIPEEKIQAWEDANL